VSVTVRRGDVVVVRLDPGEGSEIRKTRPSVVVSNDAACAADAVLQIVPLTAMPARPLRSYEARVASAESKVSKPSRAVANQLRTVGRERVARVVGHVTAEELRAIELAIVIQLGLPH
jgi:mRNA interferase MazF